MLLVQNKTARPIDLSIDTGDTRKAKAYDNNQDPSTKTIRVPSHSAEGKEGHGVQQVPDAFCETLYAKSLISSGELEIIKRFDSHSEVRADG